MQFSETPLKDAFLIELDPRVDNRGFFMRSYCVQEFQEAGIDFRIVNINHSMSEKARSLRGLHYQKAPKSETKIIRCLRGAFYDVIIDLRSDSPSFNQWYGIELSQSNNLMLYIPKGFAHGFLTLKERSEALYLTDEFYSPEYEAGIRWDDPHFDISWPEPIEVISDKDASWPDFREDDE